MKKLILILIPIIIAFLVGRFFDKIKKRLKMPKFKLNFGITTVIVAIACLLLGILIGKGPGVLKNIAQNLSKFKPNIRISLPVRVTKPLIISDFESLDDFKKWQTKTAALSQATEHATQGKFSGKMEFKTGAEFTNVLIQDYFDDNPKLGNWDGFSLLKFDIFNPSQNSEQLVLKIKDTNGKAWQTSFYLLPNRNNETKIYVNSLKNNLDVSRIRQFNFFRGSLKNDIIFYIDNIRLIPENAQNQSQTQADLGSSAKKGFLFEAKDSDFGIGVESSSEKVFLEPRQFKGQALDTVEISMAANEYESNQLVIFAKKTLENLTIETTDLIAETGSKKNLISKKNIKCFVVGYVKTQKPGYDVSYVGYWPDPLEEKAAITIKENTIQPLWIQIYTPKDTPSADYLGEIILKYAGSKTKSIKLKVHVFNFFLPKENHLKTAFDFYDSGLRRMYVKKEGEDSQEYNGRLSQLKTKYYLDMIKHRLMPIENFDLNDSYSLETLKFYLDNGLSSFAIGKYSGSNDNNWPKEPNELNALIDVYREYAKILRDSNLIDKSYLYTYDEPGYGDPFVDDVTKMIHKADPSLKNMVCLNKLDDPKKYPGWGDDIDIWCVRNVVFNEKIAKIYRDRGKEVWIYVSGPHPPFPTLVIDYPAMAYRIVPWMCWKYDIKGYLYWCVNKWEDNPWENPMNTKWEQNGNGLLYYPGADGPVTSIRLEVTRDGLEDYEYLYLLNEILKEFKGKNLDARNRKLLKKAEGLLKIDNSIAASMEEYTKDPQVIEKRRFDIANMIENLDRLIEGSKIEITEDFTKATSAVNGKKFGSDGQLTFELFRNGTFNIDGKSGFAWQVSESYRDSAIIRSTEALPKTYKISVVLGEIDYGLERIEGLPQDPDYSEGPQNENGVYLLAITDELPSGHHTNDWWHQHRKVVIDVDNNIWGSGMPNPIFMIYLNKDNKLVCLDGQENHWVGKWRKGITYDSKAWYKVEIEKTNDSFILRVFDSNGKMLKGGIVPLEYVWHADGNYPEYFVIGDPHENYYQGSMKIKSISIIK